MFPGTQCTRVKKPFKEGGMTEVPNIEGGTILGERQKVIEELEKARSQARHWHDAVLRLEGALLVLDKLQKDTDGDGTED